jgi:Holliday junction DNA helicase RuvA
MIARLRGVLVSFAHDHAVVDVGGVGYLVGASTRTLSGLGATGEEVVLHTEMLVAEDFIRLVGFGSAEERDWFRLLTSVQGVGARVALGILSALTGNELHRAIMSGDKAMVARSQGVGPKLAQRIVNELKDKAGGVCWGAQSRPPRRPAATPPMRFRRCRTWVSDRPKPRPPSPRRRMNLAKRPASTRSSGWRSRRRRGRSAA